MDINQGTITGTVKNVQSLSTRSGSPYAALDLEIPEWNGKERVPSTYGFSFFGHAADAVLSSIRPGDCAMVSYKLRHNRNGYMDIQAISAMVIQARDENPTPSQPSNGSVSFPSQGSDQAPSPVPPPPSPYMEQDLF